MIGIGIGIGLGLNLSSPRPEEEDVPRKYMFIDGAFWEAFIETCRQRFSAISPTTNLDIDYGKIGRGYDRVFYYNSFPRQKKDEKKEDFEERLDKVNQHFEDLSSLMNFHVRTGITRRGYKQEQKGVDVLLAIDVLLHAVRNNIDEATIVTSDTDFFPLFEALQQTKTKSRLLYDINKRSTDLINFADTSSALNEEDFLNWLKVDQSLLSPQARWNIDTLRHSNLLSVGQIGDFQAELHQGPDSFYFLRTGNRDNGLAYKLEFMALTAAHKVHGERYIPSQGS